MWGSGLLMVTYLMQLINQEKCNFQHSKYSPEKCSYVISPICSDRVAVFSLVCFSTTAGNSNEYLQLEKDTGIQMSIITINELCSIFSSH